jgi:hypothetical protein
MDPGQEGLAIFPESSEPQCKAAVACHVPIRLEGRARTLSGPSPDLGRARILTNRFADQAVDLRLPGLPFLLVAAVLRAVADVPWVAQ